MSKYLPISISSNKILKILVSPPTNDSSIDFNNLFAKIKSEDEKNAISFLTIAIGNVYYSGKATTYIMQKLNIDQPFQLNAIPIKEIQNFWHYIPSFVNSNKALSQFFHLFLTFIPKNYDNVILSSIMNIKCENQILLSYYIESMQDFYNNYSKFLKKFLVDNFPTPLQIQSINSILVKRDKTFTGLLKLYEANINTPARFSLEYSLIFYLSSFYESVEMLNNISNMMMLFLTGIVDFKSQIFDSLCFFINKSVTSLELPNTKEEYDDFPFYLFKMMKKKKTPSINVIAKQSIQNIKNLTPLSIYYLFAINNENLSKMLAFQLINLKDPLPIIEKCYKKGKAINHVNILNLFNYSICALFVRTPLDNPSFKQISEYVKKVSEIQFPIQFLSKIADMVCMDEFRDLAFELLKIDDETRSNIFLKLNEIVEADYPTNKIDEDFINSMNDFPNLTAHVFLALCSSLTYTSIKSRKNRLISIVKRTLLTCFQEIKISYDVIASSIPGLDTSISNFQELFDYMKKSCGKESDFHTITDETFNNAVKNQSFKKKKV